MTLPTYKCVRGQDSHTPNHPLRPYRHDHPTTAVATPKRKRDTKSIHSPKKTRTFTREGLLYSFPINDDRRGGLHVSKILRVALPIAFIVVFYAGEPAGTLFGCRAFNVIPPLMWLLLLVTLGAANAAIAFGLVRTERTRDLALWGLILKVCFLPIFLVSLVVFALIGSQFSLRPEALPLEFALLTPCKRGELFSIRGITAGICPAHPLCRPVIRSHDRHFVLRIRGDYPRARRAGDLP